MLAASEDDPPGRKSSFGARPVSANALQVTGEGRDGTADPRDSTAWYRLGLEDIFP
jgi:hypothetical protein